MATFTAEQLKSKYAGTLQAGGTAAPVQPEKPGFLGGVRQAIGQRAEALGSRFDADQSAASDVFQTFGAGAGLAGDIAFEGLKAVTPDAVEDVVSAGVQKVAQTAPVQAVAQKYEAWKTAHPEAAANFESTVDVASIVPAVKGAKITASGAKAAGEGTASVLQSIAQTPKSLKNMRLALTELDPQAETILKQTELPEFESYYDAASKAAVDPRQPTPMELAGNRGQEALDQIQRKMEGIGTDKRTVLSKAAIGRKPVGNIVLKFRQELQNAYKGGVAVKGDATLMETLLKGAERLGPNPSAEQVDHFIDSAQDVLYAAGHDLTVPVTTGGTAQVRAMVGKLNEDLKKSLPDSYRNVNQQFHDLVGVRDELNTKLGKEGERAGALMKRVFSPSDANTKTLFERVKKETGVDLVKEATLARFVMESVGDVRQKSLLKQLDIASKDLGQVDLTRPGTWLQFLRDRIDLDPSDAAREVIKKSTSDE